MKTLPAKRVEIIIEIPMKRRLTAALTKADISGFTIMPVLGGAGKSGQWSREGQVSSAGGMVQFVCIMPEDRLDTALNAISHLVKRHIGIVCITDCEVLDETHF